MIHLTESIEDVFSVFSIPRLFYKCFVGVRVASEKPPLEEAAEEFPEDPDANRVEREAHDDENRNHV